MKTRDKAKIAYSKCQFKSVEDQTPLEIAGFYLSAWGDARLRMFSGKIRVVAEIIDKALEEEEKRK